MTCPNCGREMDYVAEYDRYVCFDACAWQGVPSGDTNTGCGYEEDASLREVSE